MKTFKLNSKRFVFKKTNNKKIIEAIKLRESYISNIKDSWRAGPVLGLSFSFLLLWCGAIFFFNGITAGYVAFWIVGGICLAAASLALCFNISEERSLKRDLEGLGLYIKYLTNDWLIDEYVLFTLSQRMGLSERLYAFIFEKNFPRVRENS